MVPDMPMPLPVAVDLTVTSANAGTTGTTSATKCNERDAAKTLHSIISRGKPLFYCCCCVLVVRGLAFFAHSFAQFSISATVCSTDSRAA